MATKQIHQYTAATMIDGAADFLLIDPASTGTYNKINRNVLLGITTSPVGQSDSQTLSNKTLDNTNIATLKASNFTLQDASDTTKQAKFSAAGITTGTTRTYTLPNATDTLAGIAATQTLTNKTITSPTITGGTIDNSAITVDSISGHTSATIVSVGGVQMNNGTIGTSGAIVSASIANGAVQPQHLVTGTGTSWPWQTWNASSWTNLTVGNGVVTSRYAQIGKTVCFTILLVFGSSTVVTGSNPRFPLPVTSKSDYIQFFPIGTAGMNAGGAGGVTPAQVAWYSSTLATFAIFNAAGTYAVNAGIDASTPFSPWTTGYQLWAVGMYEAA